MAALRRVSETSRMDDGSLRFSASDVRAGQYLDVVAAYDASAVKPPSGWRQGDAAWVRQQARPARTCRS